MTEKKINWNYESRYDCSPEGNVIFEEKIVDYADARGLSYFDVEISEILGFENVPTDDWAKPYCFNNVEVMEDGVKVVKITHRESLAIGKADTFTDWAVVDEETVEEIKKWFDKKIAEAYRKDVAKKEALKKAGLDEATVRAQIEKVLKEAELDSETIKMKREACLKNAEII